MFKIVDDSEKTYFWPVDIWVPRGDGKKTKATIRIEFAPLPQDEQAALIASSNDVDDDTLWQVVRGWKDGDVQDADGAQLTYSEEAKRKLLNITYVRAAVARAYFASINGAREKN